MNNNNLKLLNMPVLELIEILFNFKIKLQDIYNIVLI